MTQHHICDLCKEDALAEWCPNFRLPGEAETAAEWDFWARGDQGATIVLVTNSQDLLIAHNLKET